MKTAMDRRKVELLRGSTERRSFGAALEVRKSASGTHLSGYASTFGGSYEVQGFRERIERGAFKNTLSKKADVVLLVGHEGIPLARTKSGTLKLSEDARGLRVNAELDPKNPLVQSLLSPLRRGDLTEMSFAFRAVRDQWNESRSMRRVLEVDMNRADVSVVTHGANPETSLSLRRRGVRKRSKTVVGSYQVTAKARRERLRLRGERRQDGSDASMQGQEPEDRYSQSQIDALGREGRALKKKSGGWHFPIADRRDPLNAIKAFGRATPSEAAAVKAFIRVRARVMRMESLLPASWQLKVPTPVEGGRA